MTRSRIVISLALLSLLFAAGSVFAAEPAQLRIQAEKLENTKTEGNMRITVLSKAKVTHGEANFSADTVTLRSENNIHEVTGTGSPKFSDPVSTVTADTFTAYPEKHQADFTGSVRMLITSKPAEGQAAKPITFTADKLSYDYANRRAVFSGNVTMQMENLTVTFTGDVTFDWNTGTVSEAEPKK